jgi:carbon storage regulator CsrA
MLILARKQNESIVVSGHIRIKVLEVKGNTVRIGIEAPQEVKILRGELVQYEVNIDIGLFEPNSSTVTKLARPVADR